MKQEFLTLPHVVLPLAGRYVIGVFNSKIASEMPVPHSLGK